MPVTKPLRCIVRVSAEHRVQGSCRADKRRKPQRAGQDPRDCHEADWGIGLFASDDGVVATATRGLAGLTACRLVRMQLPSSFWRLHGHDQAHFTRPAEPARRATPAPSDGPRFDLVGRSLAAVALGRAGAEGDTFAGAGWGATDALDVRALRTRAALDRGIPRARR